MPKGVSLSFASQIKFGVLCGIWSQTRENKTVLLRDRKRRTARAPPTPKVSKMLVQFFVQKFWPFFVQNFVHFLSQILSNIFVQIWGGVPPGAPPQLGGLPPGAHPPVRGVPTGVPPSWGVPRGRPPVGGVPTGVPPQLGGYPGAPPSWGGTPGGTPPVGGGTPGAPPPSWGGAPLWTDKLKTLPSRHTPYAGGKNKNRKTANAIIELGLFLARFDGNQDKCVKWLYSPSVFRRVSFCCQNEILLTLWHNYGDQYP